MKSGICRANCGILLDAYLVGASVEMYNSGLAVVATDDASYVDASVEIGSRGGREC